MCFGCGDPHHSETEDHEREQMAKATIKTNRPDKTQLLRQVELAYEHLLIAHAALTCAHAMLNDEPAEERYVRTRIYSSSSDTVSAHMRVRKVLDKLDTWPS